MFDVKSDCWIRFYKTLTIILFFLFVVFGIVAGIGDCSSEYLDIGIGGDDDGFLDLFVWILSGSFLGFSQLVANMLIIQLLNNVQLIREQVEQLHKAPTERKESKNVPNQTNTTAKTCESSMNAEKAEQSKATFSVTDGGTIICSQCKYEQASGRKVCWHCGAEFKSV